MIKIDSGDLFNIHKYVNYDEGMDTILPSGWESEDPELAEAASKLKEAREKLELLLETREVGYEE